jgi:hypothetical protein
LESYRALPDHVLEYLRKTLWDMYCHLSYRS